MYGAQRAGRRGTGYHRCREDVKEKGEGRSKEWLYSITYRDCTVNIVFYMVTWMLEIAIKWKDTF